MAPATSLDVEGCLAKLSKDDKVALLSGANMWHTHKVESLGIPPLRVSDGRKYILSTSGSPGHALIFCTVSCGPYRTPPSHSFSTVLTTQKKYNKNTCLNAGYELPCIHATTTTGNILQQMVFEVYASSMEHPRTASLYVHLCLICLCFTQEQSMLTCCCMIANTVCDRLSCQLGPGST